MLVVLTDTEDGTRFMVPTNSRVGIMTIVAHKTRVKVVTNLAIGPVIFKNPLCKGLSKFQRGGSTTPLCEGGFKPKGSNDQIVHLSSRILTEDEIIHFGLCLKFIQVPSKKCFSGAVDCLLMDIKATFKKYVWSKSNFMTEHKVIRYYGQIIIEYYE